MPKRIVLSACLAGLRTRYDGSSRPHPLLEALRAKAVLVPVCPEILGGLGIPRLPCRFSGGDGAAVLRGEASIIDTNGTDRTVSFVRGAEETARVVALISPDLIIFKEGSPSCGIRRVDIEGKKQQGSGVATALLARSGIALISEEDPLPEANQV
jgi:uncharacterized protein YbbK (DUF523 family)